MPTGWPSIRSCIRSWAAALLMRKQPLGLANGAVRDRDAGLARELGGAGRTERPLFRPLSRRQWPDVNCARHGQLSQPAPWRAGRGRIERAFRLQLLSLEVPVQPVRHAGTLCAAHWPRPQCRRLAGFAIPVDCPLRWPQAWWSFFSAPTPPMPAPLSVRGWHRRAISTAFGCQPTTSCARGSRIG